MNCLESKLIKKLQTGEITQEELTYDEVEKILFHKFKNNILSKFKSARVNMHKKGPIDIIVESQFEVPSITLEENISNYIIYIECKQRGRKLELDETAKVFLVAIADLPNELVIVSKSGISPQALRYAYHFFTIDNSTGYFKNIKFRVTSINEIFGIESINKVLSKNLIENSIDFTINKTNGIISQEIYHSLRSKKILIALSNLHYYTIEVFPKGISVSELYIKSSNEELIPLTPLKPRVEEKCKNSMSFKLSSNTLLDLNNKEYTIMAKYSNGQLHKLPEFKYDLIADDLFNFLIQPKEWKSIFKTLSSNLPSIILLEGIAGIGKSFFCGKLIGEYRNRGYRCSQITISDFTSNELIYRILWNLMWPGGEAPKNNKETIIAEKIISRSLRKLLGDTAEGDKLAEEIIHKQFNSDNIIEYIILIVQIISKHPEENLIYIQDAHKLSPELLRTFSILFSRLQDSVLGKFTFLFEYRTLKNVPTNNWNLFKDNLLISNSSEIEHLVLHEIDKNDLKSGLSKIITNSDIDDLAEILFQKTGGNLLFIDQLLRYFIRHNILQLINKYMFHIVDWVALNDRISDLPLKINSILSINTLNLLQNYTQERNFKPDELFYIISRLYIDELEQEKVCEDLKVTSESIQEVERLLIKYGFTKPSISSETTVFSHELIETSLKSEVKQLSCFGLLVRRIQNSYKPNNIRGYLSIAELTKDSMDYKYSFACYDKASVMASNSNNYSLNRIALNGCYFLMLQENSSNSEILRKTIAIGLKLSSVEIQAGSQLSAKKILNNIENNIFNLSEPLYNSEKYISQHELLKNKLILHTRLMEPHYFIENFVKIFKIKELSGKHVNSLLTRFILICCAVGFPKYAMLIASKMLKNKIGFSDQELSSFYSDIGRIYMQCEPRIGYDCWKLGAKYDVTFRQLNHNRLNILVGKLLADNIYEDDVSELENILNKAGVENQKIRLKIYKSLKFFFCEDWEQAIFETEKIIDLCKSVNQIFWMWKCYNNIALAFVKLGDFSSCNAYIEKGLQLINNISEFNQHEEDSISQITKEILSNYQFLKDSENLKPPLYSGLFKILEFNDQIINKQNNNLLRMPINIEEDHLLLISFKDSSLFLAIE